MDIDHLADIARELDVTPQAVSNWKARNTVPYKYVKIIREKTDDNLTDQPSLKTQDNSHQISSIPYAYGKFFDEESVSVSKLLILFARHVKKFIVFPIIVCSIAFIYYHFFTIDIYQSSARILSSTGIGPSQAAGIASFFGIPLPTSNSEPQWAYPDIINSRTFAKKMLKRKFDTKKYGKQKTLLQILTYGDFIPKKDQMDNYIRSGVAIYVNMIDILPSGNGHYLTVTTPYDIEQINGVNEGNFARDLLIGLIDELKEHLRTYNKMKTKEARIFIENRIVDIEKELNKAEEKLKNFRDRNRRIENSPALLLEEERLSREVSVIIGVFTTLKQQLETTKIEQLKESEYIIVLDPPESPIYPSSPDIEDRLVMALFLGLVFAGLTSFLQEISSRIESKEKKKIKGARYMIFENIIDLLPNFIAKRLIK